METHDRRAFAISLRLALWFGAVLASGCSLVFPDSKYSGGEQTDRDTQVGSMAGPDAKVDDGGGLASSDSCRDAGADASRCGTCDAGECVDTSDTSAVDISAGDQHSCAVLESGEVRCWGSNHRGQLGNGVEQTREDQQDGPRELLPVTVSIANEPLADVQEVSAGLDSTCATQADGGAYCWGGNHAGQLGIGAHGGSSVPLRVQFRRGALQDVEQIAVGWLHACARQGMDADEGSVLCWGYNEDQQVGSGDMGNVLSPTEVRNSDDSAALAQMKQVATGRGFSCALSREGTVWCWGAGDHGRLGHGTNAPSAFPVQVQDGAMPLRSVTQIAVGFAHACGLIEGGEVLCWGQNRSVQLGRNGLNESGVALPVLEGSSNLSGVKQISAGESHTCALLRDSRVVCWGLNGQKQLGSDERFRSSDPVLVHLDGDALEHVQKISCGKEHTCALREDGKVFCWGLNTYGQLGDGTNVTRAAPMLVRFQ